MDNFSGGASRRPLSVVQGELFDCPVFHREKATMQERLAAFAAALRASHGGHESRHHQESVDRYRKFLDELRKSQR